MLIQITTQFMYVYEHISNQGCDIGTRVVGDQVDVSSRREGQQSHFGQFVGYNSQACQIDRKIDQLVLQQTTGLLLIRFED